MVKRNAENVAANIYKKSKVSSAVHLPYPKKQIGLRGKTS